MDAGIDAGIDAGFDAGLKTFTIYEYLAGAVEYVNKGVVVTASPPPSWFEAQRLTPINLIYGSALLDDGGNPNLTAIQRLSAAADSTGAIPVGLDLEEWDSLRFHDAGAVTANILSVLQPFRANNPTAVIGLYSEVPQNTYGRATTAAIQGGFASLNAEYAGLAHQVDYLAPSLYNYGYDGGNFSDWVTNAQFNVQQARLYSDGGLQRVVPYITGYWTKQLSDGGSLETLLTYDEMTQRLSTLASLGADGCIVWMPYQLLKQGTAGHPILLDPNANDWFGAIAQFAARGR
jgi:hypothetical protein